jgi:WhiB family transcriptional regulator, redox-sensing transcriptional regulator
MRKPLRLPPPLLDAYEWQDHALCRQLPVETFFEADNHRGSARARAVELAREVCLRCPVMQPCLEHALVAEDFGVWGGLTADERAALRSGRRAKTVTTSA